MVLSSLCRALSLALVLGLPTELEQRNLLTESVYGVIWVTLLGQDLTLRSSCRTGKRNWCVQKERSFAYSGLPDLIHDDSLEPIMPSASVRSPRRLSMRMNTLITNTHVGKTSINQDVMSVVTSSTNASA
jgi:hypothetical protein